ncbi:hypothetical protein ACHAWO_005956 [Cyclotella atomus]|uniref:Uncharacterized protein n=1 Tax=Cyclotella atomus TaxID=382360 RepID=A0ABD3NP08_9STRA
MSEDVKHVKHDNTMAARWLSDMHEHNDKVKEKDLKRVNRLVTELAAARNKVNREREENIALRGILTELKSLLPNEMADSL